MVKYGLDGMSFDAEDSAATARLDEAARRWALEEILIQEARRQGLDQDSLFVSRMENLYRDVLINLLYETTAASITVDSEEIHREYEQHRGEYAVGSDQVDLLYISAPTRELANQARTELQNGTELGEILALNDQLYGEKVGWVSEDDLNRPIANLAFALVPGGISYPMKQEQGGYAVLQCLQRRQAGTIMPLEEMQEEIRGRIFLSKRLMVEKALRDSLWAVYNPQILLNVNE